MVESCNAMVSQRPAATFSAKHLEQDLAKLLKSRSVEQHRDVLDRTLAAAALAGGQGCWAAVLPGCCAVESARDQLPAATSGASQPFRVSNMMQVAACSHTLRPQLRPLQPAAEVVSTEPE